MKGMRGKTYGKLKKSIYGLVQAAREFYRHIKYFLINTMNFEQCKTDACLFRRTINGINMYLGLYVDDILLIGRQSEIENVMKKVEQKFGVRRIGPLGKYIGVQVTFHQEKAYLKQNEIINKLIEDFDSQIKDLPKLNTPTGPGTRNSRPTNYQEILE